MKQSGCLFFKLFKNLKMNFDDIGGPDWFWKTILTVSFIGCLAMVSGFIYLIVWLIKHLKII